MTREEHKRLQLLDEQLIQHALALQTLIKERAKRDRASTQTLLAVIVQTLEQCANAPEGA